MKKWIVFLLLAASLLGLTGCASEPSQAESWDRIPMVMIDGVLYLDTGFENADIRECGLPDGEITSTVDGSERPTKDDQSNFGTGYVYQYGTEGTVEICINDRWWIYATEEARENLQFPDR